MNFEEFVMHEEVTPAEFAQAIGVSRSTVYFWLDSGELVGSQNVTGRRKITVTAILQLLRDRSTKDQGKAEAAFRSWLRARYAAKAPQDEETISANVL